MHGTPVLLAGSAFAALTAATVFAAGSGAVGATEITHTLSFQAQATDQLSTGPQSFIVADQDVVGTQVVGHDVLTCTATQTHSNCDVAFAQQGGLLYARFELHDADHSLTGAVAGGTGRYRHAHGTLTGAALSKTTVQINLSYQN